MTELEPLSGQGPASSAAPPAPLSNGTSPAPPRPSLDQAAIRDLLVSVTFFLVGWWGPKLMLPSEEYLQEREIPYQVLSTGDVILDLSLDNPLVQPPTVPCKSMVDCNVSLKQVSPLTIMPLKHEFSC